jgi:hypothetical protein
MSLDAAPSSSPATTRTPASSSPAVKHRPPAAPSPGSFSATTPRLSIQSSSLPGAVPGGERTARVPVALLRSVKLLQHPWGVVCLYHEWYVVLTVERKLRMRSWLTRCLDTSDMISTNMQRPAYPPMSYHTPQSNSPASVNSPSGHDQQRSIYGQPAQHMHQSSMYYGALAVRPPCSTASTVHDVATEYDDVAHEPPASLGPPGKSACSGGDGGKSKAPQDGDTEHED